MVGEGSLSSRMPLSFCPRKEGLCFCFLFAVFFQLLGVNTLTSGRNQKQTKEPVKKFAVDR